MWDDALTRLITKELQEIEALLGRSSVVLSTPSAPEPSFERLAALAHVITSFYTGIERIFERIARRCDGGLPSGDRWHLELLIQVAQATVSRPALISEASRHALREYLAFRHRSRHAYSHHLEWAAMEPLVARVPQTWDRVRAEVEGFVARQASSGPREAP
jgi:hypothetical protein